MRELWAVPHLMAWIASAHSLQLLLLLLFLLLWLAAEQSGNAINTLGRNCVPNAFRWLRWQSTLAMASEESEYRRIGGRNWNIAAPTSSLVLICLAHLQEMCP